MKVCIVSSGDFFGSYGGGQVYVNNLVDELALRHDITVSVISYCPDKEIKTSIYKGISIFQVSDNNSFLDAIKQIQPDIIHANGEKLRSALLCKELGIPCVITAHHGGLVCPAGTLLNTKDEICHIRAEYSHCLKCYLRHTRTGLFWYPLLKLYNQKYYIKIGLKLKNLPFIPFLSPIGETGLIVSEKLNEWNELKNTATHFIAPSDAIAEALKNNSCPQEKITIIPHGIPSNNSQFTIKYTKPIRFYYVGRINYVKGIHILLQSFHSIDNPNIELHLIGGAGNKEELRYEKRLRKRYRRDNRIIWHGKIPYNQMVETLKSFHCLVHPAIYLEVFGLNISEAIAQNKYVIATRCGGAEMQIHNESEGLLVTPNNNKELQSALELFIANPHQSTAEYITIKQHIDNLLILYNTIIYRNHSLI